MSREFPATSERATATWRARWAVARRELQSLRSEKTIVLAIAIQLFIAAFSSFLVVGLVSMYDPSGVEGQQLEVAITGADVESLLAAVNEQDALSGELYDDPADAYAAFDQQAVSAVVEANRDDDGTLVVVVTAPDEGIGTTLLITQLQETLATVEFVEREQNVAYLESTPLSPPPEIEASPYFGFTYTVLLPLLLFLPVFISGSIAVDSLIEERQRGTLELLRVAPLSFADVMDAKLLATAALAPVQAAVWILLLVLNGTTIVRPLSLLVFVAALSLVIVAFGLAVSLYAPDRRQAQLLYSGGIVALLVSSTLLPEHPANTIAKLAIGSETTVTWLSLVGYVVLGILALGALHYGIRRIDVSGL